MKEIVTKILNILAKESESSADVAADVRALRNVFFAMGPEFRTLLEDQRALQRHRHPSHPDMHKMWLGRLHEEVAKLSEPNVLELYTTQGGAD